MNRDTSGEKLAKVVRDALLIAEGIGVDSYERTAMICLLSRLSTVGIASEATDTGTLTGAKLLDLLRELRAVDWLATPYGGPALVAWSVQHDLHPALALRLVLVAREAAERGAGRAPQASRPRRAE